MKNTPELPTKEKPGATLISGSTYKLSEFFILCIGPFCQSIPVPFFREEIQ